MVVRGKLITNKKNGKEKQVFKFKTVDNVVEYRVGKDGKKIEQSDKKGSKVVKTVDLKKGVRAAATRAAGYIYKNVLRSMALRNSVKNSTKTHKMKIKFYLVTRKLKDKIIFTYECEGLLKPVPKKKIVPKKNGSKKTIMRRDYKIKAKFVSQEIPHSDDSKPSKPSKKVVNNKEDNNKNNNNNNNNNNSKNINKNNSKNNNKNNSRNNNNKSSNNNNKSNNNKSNNNKNNKSKKNKNKNNNKKSNNNNNNNNKLKNNNKNNSNNNNNNNNKK